MRQIAWFETIGGVQVPVDEYGEYLEWRALPPHTTLAGPLFEVDSIDFVIGDPAITDYVLGFGTLPDGQVAIKVMESVVDGFAEVPFPAESPFRTYKVLDAREGPEYAFKLTQYLLGLLGGAGGEHDEEWTAQDAYHFFEAVTAACGFVRAGGGWTGGD